MTDEQIKQQEDAHNAQVTQQHADRQKRLAKQLTKGKPSNRLYAKPAAVKRPVLTGK